MNYFDDFVATPSAAKLQLVSGVISSNAGDESGFREGQLVRDLVPQGERAGLSARPYTTSERKTVAHVQQETFRECTGTKKRNT